MNEPIHVNDNAFEKVVLKSSQPVLVDFWANWCAPCRMLAPNLERLAREYADRIVVAKVDIDENQEWASHFQVKSIPTMLFISGGKVVYEQVGAAPYEALKKMVDQFLVTTGQAEKAAV